MPRVGIYDPQVAPAQTTGARFQAASTKDVARAIGAGLQDLGAGLGQYAATLHQVEVEKAETEAREGDTALVTASTKIMSDPQTGILSLQGKSAIDAYPEAISALEEEARKIKEGLSARAAEMFDRASRERIATLRSSMSRHVAVENRQWQEDVATARIAASRSDAISAAEDWERGDRAIATAQDEAEQRAKRAGAPETIDSSRFTTGSAIRLGVISRLADESPATAEQYLTHYRASLTGDDLAAAEKTVRIGHDRFLAEQRRAAAEARANASLAVRERREDLATAKAALDTGAGTSADWEDLSQGYAEIGDTSAALSAKAQAAQTRAAETHRGATIGEIDGRISALNAKTGKSVGEASELKGLETLRAQKVARLAQPGGALAEYQFVSGRALEPLSNADPDTYRRRASIAVTAAQFGGRRLIEPLTGPEAQPLKDMVAGASADRLKALTVIARFGEARVIDGAARQVSDKADGAFRIAATLSTLPGDAGYQAARDILRGPEAAKTNGDVFQPKQAQLAFTTYAAPALRGLSPDYSADVMDAAKNLFYARMTAAGRTRWDDQAWRDSLDTALGAYRVDGVKYGGIVEHRGTTVSLPPGWTGDGLFRRLARASGKDLSAATVGRPPQWADGSPVYSGQLREMVPVRLGGTRYGFMTRNARLLGAAGGGVFTIDVAKVPWK